MRTLRLGDGCGIRVLEAGPADGTPVILVHGWAGSAFLWRHNILPLAGSGCRVMAIDLPGHGRSDAPQDASNYTLATFTRRMQDAVGRLAPGGAVVAAQSMGGRIAVELAIEAPQLVKRLVLFGPVGFGETPAWRAIAPFVPALPGALPSLVVPRAAVEFVQRRIYGKLGWFTDRDVDEYWAPSQFPDTVRAQLRMLQEFAWEPVAPERLALLRASTHVVFGTRDRTVRPVHAERLAAALPAGRLTWIPDGGHVVMEEIPPRINALLLSEATTPG